MSESDQKPGKPENEASHSEAGHAEPAGAKPDHAKPVHTTETDDGLTEHIVAMADEELPLDEEELTVEKVREIAQHHHEQEAEAELFGDVEPVEPDVPEDELTFDQVRDLAEEFYEEEEEKKAEQAAVEDEEEMTLEQIREMAKHYREPGMKEPEPEAAEDEEEMTLEQIREMAKHYHEPGMKEAVEEDQDVFEDKPVAPPTAEWGHEFRSRLHGILFEMRTPLGKIVNYLILILIVAVVFTTMLATVESTPKIWVQYFQWFEEFVLYVFLLEYMLRVYSAKHRWDYVRSFNGVVDFLTVLPLLIGGQGAVAVRLLRLLRLVKITTFFPVLKSLLMSVSGALNLVMAVMGTIGLVSLLVGNLVYLVEPHTFSNAFEGLWWSLVTMSTVGYGDMVPQTLFGKILGGVLILTGIVMFAMVTAVISVRVGRMVHMNARCLYCDKQISPEYKFCPYCGENQAEDIDLFGGDEE